MLLASAKKLLQTWSVESGEWACFADYKTVINYGN